VYDAANSYSVTQDAQKGLKKKLVITSPNRSQIMNKQTELMLVEEFSDLELEAISGGAKNEGLIVVSVEKNNILNDVNVAVAAAVACSR
jgi:hypothetical protein